MAVLKHIKSRNADYSAAIDYLLFQHDEKTGKKILDEFDRNILREEFYMDGLNCAPMSFDKECQITNTRFHKNQKTSEIKSHHYIISFDPADGPECGLTVEKAQALCLELAKKIFPGYQALVVTHTDGHNASGNVHTHIVINSVQKYSAEREPYMSQPHDHEAGYKHRSTDKFLKYFKQEVMDMCHREGLHQIDLLQPAEVKDYPGRIYGKTIRSGTSGTISDFCHRTQRTVQLSSPGSAETNFKTFPRSQIWKAISGTDIFTERSDGCLVSQIASAVGCRSAIKYKSHVEFGICPPG